jgi:hypothetical protein
MAEVPLANGGVALVDDEDLPLISRYQWSSLTIHNRTYAVVRHGRSVLYMHRLLMGDPAGLDIDHKNRNGLDNRRSTNLRAVPHSVNIANAGPYRNNTSGYRGVMRRGKGWQAQVRYQQRAIQSRVLPDKHQAALLRDELARQLFRTSVYFNLPHMQPDEATVAEAARIIQRAEA